MSKLALRAVNKLSQFSLGHFIDPEQARSFLQKCYFEWFTQQSVVRCDADKTQKTRQRLCEAVQKPKESCRSLERKEAVLRHFQHQSYRRCEKWQHSDEHVTTVSSEDVHTTLRLQLCADSTCCVVSNIAKPQPWQHPKKKRERLHVVKKIIFGYGLEEFNAAVSWTTPIFRCPVLEQLDKPAVFKGPLHGRFLVSRELKENRKLHGHSCLHMLQIDHR